MKWLGHMDDDRSHRTVNEWGTECMIDTTPTATVSSLCILSNLKPRVAGEIRDVFKSQVDPRVKK